MKKTVKKQVKFQRPKAGSVVLKRAKKDAKDQKINVKAFGIGVG